MRPGRREIRAPRVRIGSAIRSLGTFVLALAVALVLVEVALRGYAAWAPTPPDSTFLPDPDCGYRLRPHAPESYATDPNSFINELGFRDRPRSRTRRAGTYRLLGIGDSFVYGSVRNLDDHFLRVAERELASSAAIARTGHDSVEVLLMGVGGYSPENEVGLLRSLGVALDPQLVVWNLYVGNDVTGIPVRTRVIAGRTYIVGSPYPWLDALRRSLLFVYCETLLLPSLRGRVLEVYMRLTHRAAPPAGAPPAASEAAARQPGDGHVSEEGRALQSVPASRPPGGERRYSRWYLHAQLKDLPVYRRMPDSRTERLWAECEGYVRAFDRTCREAGIPWVLHLIPADVQVDDELRRTVLDQTGHRPSEYDFDAPQARFRRWADELGVPCFDPLPELRAAQRDGTRLYRIDDIHWTEAGNRLAGSLLGSFLASRIDSLAGPRSAVSRSVR